MNNTGEINGKNPIENVKNWEQQVCRKYLCGKNE
jgi:hypothetical protein